MKDLPMPFTPKKRKTVFINLLLVAGSVLLVLFVLEFIFRLQYTPDMNTPVDGTIYALHRPELMDAFVWDGDGNSLAHIRSENKVMVYELRPSVHLNDVIQINAHGFRDYEYTKDKPEGVYRICVVGDSITFGWWERLEETYPKVLETLLNAHAEDGIVFEVWNMGIGGYNAEQEMELIRTRVLDFDPDMIIIGYCNNDNHIGADAGLWRHFTRSGSLAWDFISLRWMQARELWYRETLVQRSYRKIAEVTERKGIPVFVAFFYPNKPDKYWLKQIAKDIQFSKKLGMHTVDLLSAFQNRGWDETMTDGIHPNALGHEISAAALFDAVQASALLPTGKVGKHK